MRVRRRILTAGPWHESFGDPCCPDVLKGVSVVRLLTVDREAEMALVALSDQRFALTGRILAIGPADKLAAFMRRRATSHVSTTEAAWLRGGATTLTDLAA